MDNIENIDKYNMSNEDFDFLDESATTSSDSDTSVYFNSENNTKSTENNKSEELYETDTDFRTEHIRKTQGREVDEEYYDKQIEDIRNTVNNFYEMKNKFDDGLDDVISSGIYYYW